jgi:hypothetical protein
LVVVIVVSIWLRLSIIAASNPYPAQSAGSISSIDSAIEVGKRLMAAIFSVGAAFPIGHRVAQTPAGRRQRERHAGENPADDLTQMSKRLALQGYGLPESRHEPIAI